MNSKYWQIIKKVGSSNGRWDENVTTKSEILEHIIQALNGSVKNILFVCFNPIAVELAKKYSVTVICDVEIEAIFDFTNIKRVDSTDELSSKFDIIFALDEFFTYGNNEEDQRALIEKIAAVSCGQVITTLQDYKNFAPYKRNILEAQTFNGNNSYILFENNILSKDDKQSWNHYLYCVTDNTEFEYVGPTVRRTMYFKQLARYSSDAGSSDFMVEKSLLYKGFFSKTFEHIILIDFGKNKT